jgi:hypothetical protein
MGLLVLVERSCEHIVCESTDSMEHCQITSLSERTVAYFAQKGLLACVRAHVSHERRVLREPFLALLTLKGLLSCVCSAVGLKLELVGESAPAGATHVRLGCCRAVESVDVAMQLVLVRKALFA